MRQNTFIALLSLLPLFCIGQRLQRLEVGFQDTRTIKGKSVYRELIKIGDDDVISSKPLKLDITLAINGNKKSSMERIEISIEELFEPTKLNNLDSVISEKKWILHKVIYTANTNTINNRKVYLKDVDYRTAGFYDSLLYTKLGFRIVAIYYNESTKEFQRLIKAFLYPE